MSFTNLAQITLEVWGSIFLAISYLIVHLEDGVNQRRSRLLRQAIAENIMLLICDAASYIFLGAQTVLTHVLLRVGTFGLFAAIPTIAFTGFLYIRELITENGGKPNPIWTRMMQIVCTVHLGLIILSLPVHLLYRFDESNIYHRADYFWLVSAFGVVLLLIMAGMLVHHRSALSSKEFISLVFYITLPFVSNAIQLFYYGISFNSIAITIGVLMVFLTHEMEKSRRIVAQKHLLMSKELDMARQNSELAKMNAELAEKRTQISLSQMQPHFIFNCLGSIEQLCKTNPQKAAMATHQFARYVRSNMNAMSSSHQIPFNSELEHVRNYVWLEKMRFGDDIEFCEDIQTEDFSLPCLTVQPLVENAIKHAMTDDGDVLKVTLSVRELDNIIMIQVADNGRGFDAAAERNTRIHVGLENVRERIHIMAMGSLTVDSSPGKGTTVTIMLPNIPGQTLLDAAER